jgi:hypothetical protein
LIGINDLERTNGVVFAGSPHCQYSAAFPAVGTNRVVLSQQLQQLIDTLAPVSRLPPYSNDLAATYIGIRLALLWQRALKDSLKT